MEHRREAIASTWNLKKEVVLVYSGDPIPVPGSDLFHEFRAHPEYRYLTDGNLPGHILAFDPQEGWTPFVPALSEDELVWQGGRQAAGVPVPHIKDWLDVRRGRPVAILSSVPPGVAYDRELTRRLRAAVTDSRRTKDKEELARIRRAADATREGFLAVFRARRPGMTERDLRSEFEYAMLRAGGDRPAFDTIVASGSSAAVLHFTPTDRPLRAGELVLVDAGAEHRGYPADVTRTIVVEGEPTPEQRDLHALVLDTQQAAIAKCRPGREFREIHLEACVQLAQGLIDFGLLRGKADDLVERDAHALFFPHGLGHLLGLAVHDVGGYAEGRQPSERFGLKFLRTDLPLKEGYVLTIEPGLYFIEALLRDRARCEAYAEDVDWERVEGLFELGGIRIEDDVLVTAGDPEVLTADVPRDLVP